MTIFAARRVLPPDLMVPADASAPRMKLTGPLAVPPPASSSTEPRMLLRFTPAPEPPLKIRPSSTYQLRIASMRSSTAKMKHALDWLGTPGTPMLNHTGELKAMRWVTMRNFSSSLNAATSRASVKYPSRSPHAAIVSTMRSTTWRSDHSRSARPSVPRKYFWARMFVAFIDHVDGTSTPNCSNVGSPVRQSTMRASRRSHSTRS